jgi:CBS domain containing-hemolysin-like protein
MGIIIVLIIVFLLLDVFFSLIRAALFNVRMPQLVELGGQEPRKVERTIALVEKPRLRAAFRTLAGVTHLCVAAGFVALLATLNIPLTMIGWVGFFILALLVMLVFEFLFERLPLRNPEKWALALTPLATGIDWVLSPITATLIRLQGTDGASPRQLGSVNEDDLRTWVEVGQPEGGLEADERRMIYSIFQFGDTLCREIMVPRIDVLALEVKTPIAEAINALVESGHSRVPVYDDSIDNVVGILYAKDLLQLHTNPAEKTSLQKFLRPAYYIPETKKVDDLLSDMQAKGVHIAIVVDEYGGMAGLVTLEDIVEEIVGEIRDEYDQKEELLVQRVSDSEYVFKARVSLDDFNEALGTEVVSEHTDTLGGFLTGEMGRLPVDGDSVQVGDWRLTAEEVRGRRIGKIRAVKKVEEDSEESNHVN